MRSKLRPKGYTKCRFGLAGFRKHELEPSGLTQLDYAHFDRSQSSGIGAARRPDTKAGSSKGKDLGPALVVSVRFCSCLLKTGYRLFPLFAFLALAQVLKSIGLGSRSRGSAIVEEGRG